MTKIMRNGGWNVLSLFDGISCGRLALERAGIEVNKYYASEIDKYAIKITQSNYPNTIQLGDVREIDFTQFIGEIDLVIGGSPCQDLSIAKADRKGLDGSRSGLFFKFVEAIETIKPKYFLLENVASMRKEDRDKITEILGVEPIMINSALLSAQQRKRYYWTNIPNVQQPEDKGILLQDILEDGLAYLNKAESLTASYNGAVFWNSIAKHQRTMVVKPVLYNQYNEKTYEDKSASIGTNPQCSTSITGQVVVEPLPCALRTREDETGKYKRLEVKGDGKANSLTSTNTDSMVCEPIRLGQFGKGGQGQRIYSVKGKSVCLGLGGSSKENYKIDLPDGDYIVRKLTPVECERLQTLPDNYTNYVSNTQRYKSIGNGWTVDVIAHIFKNIK